MRVLFQHTADSPVMVYKIGLTQSQAEAEKLFLEANAYWYDEDGTLFQDVYIITIDGE